MDLLKGWKGATEQELVSIWGPPHNVYETGDTKYLMYVDTRNIHFPGVAPSYQTTFSGSTAYTQQIGGVAPMNKQVTCETLFEIVDGVVATSRFRGNDCVN